MLWGITVALWLAVGRLGLAFVRSELHWRTVAEHSRADAPWYYRLAGVWGGSEGSLLFFAAVVAAVASIAARRCRGHRAIWFGTATVVVLSSIALLWASPFDHLDAPAVRGFGLTPILEHPAMAVHPPLLYIGLACSLAAAMTVIDRGSAHAWLRATVAATTAAMAIGGLWSYAEQGWGGYWAWDPVENTSLLVWLAALLALHAPRPPMLGAVPWVLTLAGAALVRSGAAPSVHAFAAAATVGWLLLAAAVTTAGWLAWHAVAADRADRPERVGGWWDAMVHPVPVLVGSAAFLVVVAGTLFPPLVDLFGNRRGMVRGEFYSRTVGPLAVVMLPFLLARLRTPAARLAHVGMVVLCVGVAASTFDRAEIVVVGDGTRVEAAGRAVEGRGVSVEPGPRFDVQQVVATVRVDGSVMRPALVAYPERGGVLAETAIHPGLWRDVQVVLLDANDLGIATLEVRQRPLMWLVWLGASLTAVGALTAGRRRAVAADRPVGEPAFEPTVR